MKQTFGQYVKSNPKFKLVIIGTIGLWIAVFCYPDQWGLWVLAILLTGVAILGVSRNMRGLDGLWD